MRYAYRVIVPHEIWAIHQIHPQNTQFNKCLL